MLVDKNSLDNCPHCGSDAVVYAEGPVVFGGSGYYCLDCGDQVGRGGNVVSEYRLLKEE